MQAAGLALAQRVEKPRPLPQIFKGAESLFYILSKLNQVGVAGRLVTSAKPDDQVQGILERAHTPITLSDERVAVPITHPRRRISGLYRLRLSLQQFIESPHQGRGVFTDMPYCRERLV